MRHTFSTFLLVIACVPAAATTSRADSLEAGLASVEITSPRGYRMSGYFSERLNTGTHDPLQAKTLYLRQGKEQAALVFCDIVGLSSAVSTRARREASEKTGIPVENILIAATHSHTGPLYFGALRNLFHEQAVQKHGKDPQEQIDYPEFLARRLAQGIVEAQKAAKPVELLAGFVEQQGLSFNRRFHMKDGTVRFNPGKLNPDIVRVAGPIDPQVGLLHVRAADSQKSLGLLSVFALHLDTVGGTEYSADYPFYLERKVREALGGGCVSLFGAGTCGDINHIDVKTRTAQKGQAEAGRIGTALGDTVVKAVPTLQPVRPSLAARQAIVSAPLQEYDAATTEAARKDLLKVGTRELPFLKQVEAYKIVSMGLLPRKQLPMEVQAFRLGDDVAVVGLPGEIFVDLGLAIKKASPFRTTIVIELCNDAPGYVPTEKAFGEGSYETVNSRIRAGGGEMLVARALDLLRDLAPAGR